MKKSYLTVTDQFCGAGGSSIGAEAAGATLVMALNHWQLAIQTHNSNFPNADHDCTDVSACNPRRYPSTDILITSPECTNHSLAKGKKRQQQRQLELFGKVQVDPAEERSRATMWDVCRFAEFHRYNIIVTENVVDVVKWEPFDNWLGAMHSYGYDHQLVYLNSMFCHPTPQSRDRVYIVFWRKGNKRPNLDFRPAAWCQRCERNIEAVQSWKNPHKKWGKWGRYGIQYVYRCPDCASEVRPYYYAAANAIDWSLPIERIGDRKKPLRDRTLERIRVGLEMFKGQYMVVPLEYTHGHNRRAIPVTNAYPTQTGYQTRALVMPYIFPTDHLGDRNTHPPRPATDPWPTQTGRQTFAMAMPFITSVNHSTDRVRPVDAPLPTQMAHTTPSLVMPFLTSTNYFSDRPRGVDEPMPTQTTGDKIGITVPPFLTSLNFVEDRPRGVDEPMATQTANRPIALTIPFLTSYYSRDDASSRTDKAMPTLTSEPRHALVQAPFIAILHNTSTVQGLDEGLSTVTAGGGHHGLVMPEPFILNYYGNAAGYQAAGQEAVATVTAVDRHALVQPTEPPAVDDCGFRMLRPHEIGAAMAFPGDYVVLGNAREKVRQFGNAVTPPVMRMILERCIETMM